jgi:hypothetical protein
MPSIAIKRQDGGVSIMNLPPEADADKEIAKWKESNPGYVSHSVIDAVPQDRQSRENWSLVDGVISKPSTPSVKKTEAQRLVDTIIADAEALAALADAVRGNGRPS